MLLGSNPKYTQMCGQRVAAVREPSQRDVRRRAVEELGMKTTKFTYWQDGDYFLGFLNDYPDYTTQGMSKVELVSNLRDLLVDLESGEVPFVRKVEDLVVAE